MPLAIVAGKQAWKLIHLGRKALEHFRTLPADDRERLRGEADQVRALVAELGAATATSMRSRGERSAPGETRREPQVVMAELRRAVAALSGATANEFEALAETRRGRYAAKALASGVRRMQGDASPEIPQEAAPQQPESARPAAREAGYRRRAMGLFGKRHKPVAPVVLPDHATDEKGQMMTVEELLRRGGECEAAGDLEGAAQAYRNADELHDAEGAILLGLVLKRRGNLPSAAEALRRAEARGHREAGSVLGNLLSDNGDVEGAIAAYGRSIAAGSTDAALNLGLMLAQQGAVDEALPHLRAAEETGSATASWAIGKLLEGREDFTGAAAAYRRGADGGNAHAAYGLGAVLTKLEDPEGARAAFQRAHDLGHEGAGKVLESLDIEATARASVETGANWAQLYAAACGEVFTAANACLEVANRAIGARNMAAKRPQHEISIRHFTKYAEEAEQEFAASYRSFAEGCAAARDTAARFLAAQSDPLDAEMVLAVSIDESVLDNVATVRAIMSANYGPSPAAFVQGVQESNELMQSAGPDEGNIYRPPAAAQSDERTCPWCAETIKAAAVICRFCGRDVQVQPNAG